MKAISLQRSAFRKDIITKYLLSADG